MKNIFLRSAAIMLALFMMFAATPKMTIANQLSAPPAQGWRTSMLFTRTLTHRQAGIDIRGTVPHISDAFEAAFFINDHINEDIVASLVAEARRIRARAITFDFDYHTTYNVVSLVIYADVATTLPHTLVRSVNFCVFSGRLLTMNQSADMTIMPLAERILAEKIRSNPERYYAALGAFLADAFYITQDRLVILFDGFRLSTWVGTVERIEIYLDNIRWAVLGLEDYRPDGPYGLKMIPLYEVLVFQLGYDIFWEDCEFGKRIFVYRNGFELIELRIDDNEYIIHGIQRRSLEAAPQIFICEITGEERTYVPITFFDQILPLTTYTISRNGRITFLNYIGE